MVRYLLEDLARITANWTWNEIKGVTDGLSILGTGRGERVMPK